MTYSFRQLDPRHRRIVAAGNGCLASGLMLQLFIHPASHVPQNVEQAVVGFLLGLSIAVNLMAVRKARCCRNH